MIRITRIVQVANETKAVGRVPELDGTFFFCAIDPAIASTAIAGTNLPINIAMLPPSVKNGFVASIPAKALPLF